MPSRKPSTMIGSVLMVTLRLSSVGAREADRRHSREPRPRRLSVPPSRRSVPNASVLFSTARARPRSSRVTASLARRRPPMSSPDSPCVWPGATLTRVPYWVYQDDANYRDELRRIFEGPAWNYVCLESDLERPGDFRTTFVGEMPVIVVRAADGGIHCFENRCAHRGALIALDDSGTAKHFQCIYHAWTYDLEGNLIGVAFEKGSNGKGGMPPSFCKAEHG